jgi:hypothetical protein
MLTINMCVSCTSTHNFKPSSQDPWTLKQRNVTQTVRRSPTKWNFDITGLDVIMLTCRSVRANGRNGQRSVLSTDQQMNPARNATDALQQDLVATAHAVHKTLLETFYVFSLCVWAEQSLFPTNSSPVISLWHRTAYIVAAQWALQIAEWPLYRSQTVCRKFGAILFTPIRFSAVGCYASGLWKVMLCFRTQNVPPPPLKTHHKHRYRRRLSNCAFFSRWLARFWHWMLWLPLPLEFAVCWNIDNGQWNKHSFFTL